MGLRVIALACLVGAAFAGPVQRQSKYQCAKQCTPQTHWKLNYEPGKAYVYQMRTENNITTAGMKKQNASIEATVEFHVHSLCEGHMKLTNIKTDDKNDDLKRRLRMPTAYAYKDGKLEQVCPGPEESTQSLNIKKAILSTLVNEMPNFDRSIKLEERDSFGKCLTKYTVQNGRDRIIKKEKDLSTCPYKKISIYALKKEIPSIKFIENNHFNCTQHIRNGIIKRTQCEESHKLKSPLGKSSSLVEFSGKISLYHIETKPAEKQSWQQPLNQEEILYSVDEPREGEGDVEKAKKLLEKVCKSPSLPMDTGKHFMEVGKIVKSLSYKQLKEVYDSINQRRCAQTKELFIDAIIVAATDPCMKLMAEIVVNKETTQVKSILWPATWPLRNPTEESVAAVVPLVRQKSQSTTVAHGVSAMIRRMCSSEPLLASKKCAEVEPVREVVEIYNKKLGSRCSSDNEKEILTALTVFGNMGYHGDAHRNIVACAKDSTKSKRIRMSAIDSFRLLKDPMPHEIVEIFLNRDEPTQLRIWALNSMARHPDKKQLEEVNPSVDSEDNDQVISYMHSLFQNINKTQDPRHQKFKHLLPQLKVTPNDYWANSRNIKRGILDKASGLGAFLDLNVISDKDTKMPVTLNLQLDAVLNEEHLNLLECGVNTDGFEKLLNNIIAMKDKIPKLEKIHNKLAQKPTLEEIKEEYSYLSPKKIFENTDAEAVLTCGMLGHRLLDISTADLSGTDELIKIAELFSKMARGEKVDFSHSVVLVDTKLSIPSVTGRSYSIDLVGSTTIGVTAEAKADFLKLPRNGVVDLRFKPTGNVEFAATVGFDSCSKGMKHVSRMHVHSDVEAKIDLKDGHVAKASLTFPSENIALAKMSTNIVDIDDDGNEKPIFEKMEKKVDYCFNHLDKPLGISACASLEVPKPFMINEFPYIMPYGSGEIALKRPDNSFKSYELYIEIPKQVGPSMKFRAGFDTPGSKVPRRFAADLELKQDRHQRDLLIELISPFNSVGASCSFTKNDKLMRGSVELHTSKSPIASASFIADRTISRSRQLFEVSAAYRILNKELVGLQGSVGVINGRKQRITIDIKTNKSRTDPLAFKATIMKEGFSQQPDGKISTDAILSCSSGEFTLSKTYEKQPKYVSTNIALGYQLKGKQKHSVVISGTSHKSSNKINSNIKIESTQFPRGNMQLTWDRQRLSQENVTNDIKLTNPQNPSKPYLLLKQESHKSKTGPCSHTSIIEVPSRNIKYELSVAHDIDISERPRVNLEAGIKYAQDKHIKGNVALNYESISPLKAVGKIELKYPGGHHYYTDEIEEKDGVMVGKSQLQVQPGKKFQVDYKYKKLNKDSKLHHEYETSIQTPYSRSPIDSKASIKLDSESLAIVGQVGPHYAVQAHLKENGDNHISLKMPIGVVHINSTNEEKKKTLVADIHLKTPRPRQILASWKTETGDKNIVDMRVLLDAKKSPEKKLLFSIEEKSGESLTKLQILDKVELSLAEKERSEEGAHSSVSVYECDLKATFKNRDPIRARIQNNVTSSTSSKTIRTSLSFENKDKVYKTVWNSDIDPNSLAVKAEMHTPHKNYEKNAVGFSVHLSDNVLSSSVSIDSLDNLKVTIQSKLESDEKACHFVSKYLSNRPITPFEITNAEVQATFAHEHHEKSVKAQLLVNNAAKCKVYAGLKRSSTELQIESNIEIPNLVKAGYSFEKQPSKSSVLCYLDTYGERKADAEASIASLEKGFEAKYRVKIASKPEVATHLKWEKTPESFSLSTNVIKGTSPLLSTSLDGLSHRGGEKLSMKTKSFGSTLIDIEVSKDEKEYSLKTKTRMGHVNIALKKTRKDNNSASRELHVCKVALPSSSSVCYIFKGYHKNLIQSENYIIYQKSTIDVEKRVGQSPPERVGKIYSKFYIGANDYGSELTLSANGKKVGYKVQAHSRKHDKDTCSLDSYIYLPHRTSRCSFSMDHNDNNIHIKGAITPDIDDSKRQLSVEVKRDYDPDHKEVITHLQIGNQRMPKLLLLRYKLYPLGKYVGVKLDLHADKVSDKTLMLELEPKLEHGFIELKAYTNDKGLDARLKLYKQSSRSSESETRYVGEWTVVKNGDKKIRKVVLISERKSMKVLFSGPSVDYEAQGRYEPDGISFSVVSAGQKLNEVRVSISDSCAKLVVTELGIQSQICASVEDGFKLQVNRNEHTCVHVQARVDPEKDNCIAFDADRKVNEECPALMDLMNLRPLLQKISLKELKLVAIEKGRQLKLRLHEKASQLKVALEPRARKLLKDLQDHKDNLSVKIKVNIKNLQENEQRILNLVLNALPSSIRGSCRRHYRHYREAAIRYYQEVPKLFAADRYLPTLNRYLPTLNDCRGKEIMWPYCAANKLYQEVPKLFAADRYLPTLNRYLPTLNDCRGQRIVLWPYCAAKKLYQELPKLFAADRYLPTLNRYLPTFAFGRFDPKEAKIQIEQKIYQAKRYVESRWPRFGPIVPSELFDILVNALNIIYEYRDNIDKIKAIIYEKATKAFKDINDIFSQDKDLRKVREEIIIAKDKMVKLWRNREEIVDRYKRQVESYFKELDRNVTEYTKEKFQVSQYDPDSGKIRIRMCQPNSKEYIDTAVQGYQEILRMIRAVLER